MFSNSHSFFHASSAGFSWGPGSLKERSRVANSARQWIRASFLHHVASARAQCCITRAWEKSHARPPCWMRLVGRIAAPCGFQHVLSLVCVALWEAWRRSPMKLCLAIVAMFANVTLYHSSRA